MNLSETDDEDLYVRLGLEAHPEGVKCSTADIKKAYYRLALQLHPDKQPSTATTEELEATLVRFQRVGEAYAVLSDPVKRNNYDQTGRWSNTSDSDCQDWTAYFAELYGKLSEQDLSDFEAYYHGSEEEKRDLRQAYTKHKGDIGKIIEDVFCSSIDNEPRYREIIQTAIDAKQVKNYTKFKPNVKDQQKRKRAADKEALEAGELSKELKLKTGGGGEDSLHALIRNRSQQKMESLISSLEAKYAAPPKKSRSKSNKNWLSV